MHHQTSQGVIERLRMTSVAEHLILNYLRDVVVFWLGGCMSAKESWKDREESGYQSTDQPSYWSFHTNAYCNAENQVLCCQQ